MVTEIPPFDLATAVTAWLIVVATCSLVAVLVGGAMAVATQGWSGIGQTMNVLVRGASDLSGMSPRRIGAIARLTFKEAWRRKTFMIGLLFLLLFMFAGWFLSGTDPEKPARPYISFVMTAMNFLLVPMALLVACWGLPADIKARSLHTVVTKPVRRSEIVLGRMLGNILVISVVLVLVSILGYLWIRRQVPPSAQDQLIARVPQYGDVRFLDRNGDPVTRGINVGDIWEYRSFIEGATNSRAIWTFDGIDPAEVKREGRLRLEQNFEVFRTHKGDIQQQIRFQVTLINPQTDLKVPLGSFSAHEFSERPDAAVIEIPLEIHYRDAYDVNAPEKTADLTRDLIDNGQLTVEIACLDSSQYLGAAQNDLFLRLPDRTFLASYAKSCLCLWLLLVLIVILGTSASCFLKGPVATIFTGGLVLMGFVFRDYLQDMLAQLQTKGQVIGGGPVESLYRLLTRMNQTGELPNNMGTDFMRSADAGIFGVLRVVHSLIPDLKYFSTGPYAANGFDVPWDTALLPSLAITLGFFIPLFILGYFSLQLRELEHK